LCFGLPGVEGSMSIVPSAERGCNSLVEYADGSMLAQLGAPDYAHPPSPRRFPRWPEEVLVLPVCVPIARPGPLIGKSFGFEPPDHVAISQPGIGPSERPGERPAATAPPAVLNGGQRVGRPLQAFFLTGRLNFTAIAAVIDKVLQRLDSSPVKTLG